MEWVFEHGIGVSACEAKREVMKADCSGDEHGGEVVCLFLCLLFAARDC